MKKYLFVKAVSILLALVVGLGWASGIVFADEDDLNPQIEVLPGLNVEVGEEVFFSGESTTYTDYGLLGKARFEWDFGDGYVLKHGEPGSTSTESGMTVVHYFMEPGTFTVTMAVYIYDQFTSNGVTPIGEPILTGSTSVEITVTGESPMDGFELLHAPFSTRLAQFITATIPQQVAADSTNSLTVTLTPLAGGDSIILLDKTGLQTEEKFLLEQRNLPEGSYRLTAEIKEANESVLSRWTEKFSKDYQDVPAVGINEWNAICVNGEPKFIVTSTERINSGSLFSEYTTEFNTMSQIGYYKDDKHYPDIWTSYLNASQAQGWYAIGPVTGDYSYQKHPRNSSTDRMKEFVQTASNHSALLMWNWWKRNSTLDNSSIRLLPPNLAAWTFATKEEDPSHPVIATVDGREYLPYYGQDGTYYNFKNSGSLFGGKRAFFADMLNINALYPLVNRTDKTLFNKDDGVIDLYVQAINNFKAWNNELIPIGVCVEGYAGSGSVPAPTEDQVRMEAWLAVLHGAKMVSFRQNNSNIAAYSDIMKEFTASMGVYENIILA